MYPEIHLALIPGRCHQMLTSKAEDVPLAPPTTPQEAMNRLLPGFSVIEAKNKRVQDILMHPATFVAYRPHLLNMLDVESHKNADAAGLRGCLFGAAVLTSSDCPVGQALFMDQDGRVVRVPA
jgi:hypothetical protein